MNVLEPIFVKVFTNDSYACIKGKGIHAAANNIKTALQDQENTKYCLKLDIVCLELGILYLELDIVYLKLDIVYLKLDIVYLELDNFSFEKRSS